ncbi:MAG: hypothetical protein UW78_C0006G0066 [Candidatus Azambacteria bacterium GW2011_GWA1_44_9]|uniref:Uncharacterized protein n=1 Tax=Candidatus Azambacteria bacterium GW2011_GWA1_44_9 TaxID=1618610 RepID=A0A0G1KDB0_9BACT|nr:MAG: hypothetical protein UW78_C0006G0066 [Candidatus Azambacteria bacterium GW2011_GWA1_44_9]
MFPTMARVISLSVSFFLGSILFHFLKSTCITLSFLGLDIVAPFYLEVVESFWCSYCFLSGFCFRYPYSQMPAVQRALVYLALTASCWCFGYFFLSLVCSYFSFKVDAVYRTLPVPIALTASSRFYFFTSSHKNSSLSIFLNSYYLQKDYQCLLFQSMMIGYRYVEHYYCCDR